MRTRPTILFFSPEACPVPALVRQWAALNGFPLLGFSRPEEVEAIVLRGHPCLLFVDGNGAAPVAVELVRHLKLGPRHRPAWAIQWRPWPFTVSYWSALGVRILDSRLEDFIPELDRRPQEYPAARP